MALMSKWGIWRSTCVLFAVLLGVGSPASGEEQLSQRLPGAMLNRCDVRPGDSGSPLLLLQGEEPSSSASAPEPRTKSGSMPAMWRSLVSVHPPHPSSTR
jgi:hypothetical protein